MAVRSKMSTTSSRRAVVTSTSSKDDLPTKRYTETSSVTTGSADKSIANITPEDDKLIRQQLRIKPNEDYTINEGTYIAWKETGKRKPSDFLQDFRDGKVKTNPYSAVYDGDPKGDFTPQIYGKGKAPKPTSNKNNGGGVVAKEPINKLKPKPAFDSKQPSRDIVSGEKPVKGDIMVPKTVERPEGNPNLKAKKKIVYQKGAMYTKSSGKAGRKGGGLKIVEKQDFPVGTKVPRTKDKLKFKREEKLAGARERVLGLNEVALEDQFNAAGKFVKRGEKLGNASSASVGRMANIIRESKGKETKEYGKVSSDTKDYRERVSALKQTKSDIKEIGKFARGRRKEVMADTEKGKAKATLKTAKMEYKTAKKPAKFSKSTSTESLASDVARMKNVASPERLKEMKSNVKQAKKTVRGTKVTSDERSIVRKSVKTAKTAARDARQVRPDVRKALRMEKMDVKGKQTSGKRGTRYFTMDELNKKIPLSSAINKGTVKTSNAPKKANIFEKAVKTQSNAREKQKGLGEKQAGINRFYNRK
jgi:hypothetical protein